MKEFLFLFLKIMKTKLERRRKICPGSRTTAWAVSQFFHAIEFISALSYRPTTSMSTACCTVGYATVSFSASTNRYVFKRWRSSGAEVRVCGAQSCLSARTSIQGDLPFIAVWRGRCATLPTLSHSGFMRSAVLPQIVQEFVCKYAALRRILEGEGDVEGMFLAFLSLHLLGKRS